MKQKNIIIIAVVAVVFLSGGFLLWKNQQKRTEEARIAANTINYEVEAYNLAMTILAPKEQFESQIDNTKYPLMPILKITDKNKAYTIEGRVAKYSQSAYDGLVRVAKKDDRFSELVADDKLGNVPGVGYQNAMQYFVFLNVLKRDKDLYFLELRINNSKNDGDDKEIYDKPEVQNLLKSVRAKSDYKAPERDYIIEDRGAIKIKKIANDINGLKIKQQSSTGNRIELTATKDNDTKLAARISFHIASAKLGLDEVMANDYNIKKGSFVYDQTFKIAETDVKATSVNNKTGGIKTFFLFFAKDGVVFQGMASYLPENKADFDTMFESVIKNLSVDKERAKKYYSF